MFQIGDWKIKYSELYSSKNSWSGRDIFVNLILLFLSSKYTLTLPQFRKTYKLYDLVVHSVYETRNTLSATISYESSIKMKETMLDSIRVYTVFLLESYVFIHLNLFSIIIKLLFKYYSTDQKFWPFHKFRNRDLRYTILIGKISFPSQNYENSLKWRQMISEADKVWTKLK